MVRRPRAFGNLDPFLFPERAFWKGFRGGPSGGDAPRRQNVARLGGGLRSGRFPVLRCKTGCRGGVGTSGSDCPREITPTGRILFLGTYSFFYTGRFDRTEIVNLVGSGSLTIGLQARTRRLSVTRQFDACRFSGSRNANRGICLVVKLRCGSTAPSLGPLGRSGCSTDDAQLLMRLRGNFRSAKEAFR